MARESKRGRWSRDSENQQGGGWRSNKWSDWSAGWSKSSRSEWNGDKWKKDWSSSWSKSWSSDWHADRDEDRPDSDGEPARRVKLIARSADKSGAGSPSLSPSRRRVLKPPPERQREADNFLSEDYSGLEEEGESLERPSKVIELAPRRSEVIELAPRRSHPDPHRQSPQRQQQQQPSSEVRLMPPQSRRSRSPPGGPLAEVPSPASPMSVGSSVVYRTHEDGYENEALSPIDEQYEVLPVEILDDQAVPGPVRAGTPAKAQEIHARRRKDAEEARKFYQEDAVSSASKHRTPVAAVVRRDPAPVAATVSSGDRSQPAKNPGHESNAAGSRSRTARSTQLTAATGSAQVASASSHQPRSQGASLDEEAPPPGFWGASWSDLDQEEQNEFKAKVRNQIRLLPVDVDHHDAEMVVDFIALMLENNKTRKEMVEELGSFLKDHTSSFVDWIEVCKMETLSSCRSSKVEKARPRAQLTANTMGDPPVFQDSQKGKETDYVVVTKKIVLQPSGQANRSGRSRSRSSSATHSASSGSSSAAEGEAEAVPDGPTADEKRMTLLSEFTTKLQVILSKLSDKSLDDLSREKYQALAEQIQSNISKVSQEKEEKLWASGDAEEYW